MVGRSSWAPRRAGLAWVELSTGNFAAMVMEASQIADHLTRIAPAECLVPDHGPDWIRSLEVHGGETMMLTERPSWAFARETAPQVLTKHFGTTTLEGFGFEVATGEGDRDGIALRAAAAILGLPAGDSEIVAGPHRSTAPHRRGTTLEIDMATRRSLELMRTMWTEAAKVLSWRFWTGP